MTSQAGGGGLSSRRRYRSERHSTTAWRMSTWTSCASPLRNLQISAAARPAAAMVVCPATATRNEDGICGSSPVSRTRSSAAASPPVEVQMSFKISVWLCIAASLRFGLLFEHDLRANAFRVCREGKPLHTFPDHAVVFRDHSLAHKE